LKLINNEVWELFRSERIIVQTFQIHATLQIGSLVSLIFGVFFAKRHKLKFHHRFQYSSLLLSTLAVSLMIYESRGLSTFHGKQGFLVYLFIIAAILSGRIFLKRTSLLGKTLKRNEHRAIALLAILAFVYQGLNGLFTFVF
jgi:uncharacterized membrane protein YozB (DUF420 family)